MNDASVEAKEAWLESIDQTDSRVDSTAYLVVLKALGRSKRSGSPQRAEELIRKLERKAASQPSWPHLQPTLDCYNAVIHAWANSREDAYLSINRAERWLNKLRQKGRKEQPALAPNTDSYNAFLDACSKGRVGRRDAHLAREHAMKAQALLEEMIRQQESLGPESPVIPNTESFNYVIRAWTRCRDEPPVAYHVMDILKQMTAYQRQQPDTSPILPNTQSYTMTMNAFVTAAWLKVLKCQRNGLEHRQDPTKNGLEEIEMVEDILQYMHKLYDAGLDYVVPNTVTYNTLITAWARLSGPLHPDGPLRAEKVLRKMIALKEGGHPEVAPDHLSFTKVSALLVPLVCKHFFCSSISSRYDIHVVTGHSSVD
jgi:hypothetical protein